jgi:uncharacterized protein YyaL (SSP411 family)
MERESFEDDATAAIMNEHFINIKVDREERPDLDNIYMQAVVAMTRQGGWPMSVFLTPDGKPFFGGTYFPPVRRYQMPSFQEVLGSVIRVWQEDREKIRESAEQITSHIRNSVANSPTTGELNMQAIDKAVQKLAQGYDWENGGWGQAPKFPQPMAIEALLRLAARGDNLALEIAEHALQAMAKGGMYDLVGGGFARYSVDDIWLVPHFEKMLYDNAQLAQVYLHAFLLTGNERYKRVCEATLDFVIREMTHPQGGFYSSLDADSEGEEGKFYVWSIEEIQAALPDLDDSRLILAAYGITPGGNFEGKNVLQRVLDDTQISEAFGLPVDQVPHRLAALHDHLLAFRANRIRPGTDDKVLVSWNGLMLIAFAEAGRYLKRPDYTQVAIKNAGFLLNELRGEGKLLRSWRDKKAQHNGYLEDHAALALGLVALYQTDPQVRWYKEASALAAEMITHFKDPEGGFFDTRDDHENLILRPKDTQDNAFPSGNALAALALLQLATLNGNGNWFSLVEGMLQRMVPIVTEYPTSFGQWLTAIDFAVGPVKEVAILGEIGSTHFNHLVASLWDTYRPRTLAALSHYPIAAGSPDLLLDRPIINKLATAYVCRNFTCQQPVTSGEALREQLG